MQDSFQPQPPLGEYGSYQPRARSGAPVWLWLLLGGGLLICLPCGGGLIWVIYLGVYGPETTVYAGNEVPNRFIATMKDVGALDEEEDVLYFYSDAMSDVRNGFYFVSDKKVAIYTEAAGGTPLTVVRFEEIADLELYRNESFFEDSRITLQLKDGRPVSFPVSSETGGDQRFFDAIKSRTETGDTNNR